VEEEDGKKKKKKKKEKTKRSNRKPKNNNNARKMRVVDVVSQPRRALLVYTGSDAVSKTTGERVVSSYRGQRPIDGFRLMRATDRFRDRRVSPPKNVDRSRGIGNRLQPSRERNNRFSSYGQTRASTNRRPVRRFYFADPIERYDRATNTV
jgi:hypothetical protein